MGPVPAGLRSRPSGSGSRPAAWPCRGRLSSELSRQGPQREEGARAGAVPWAAGRGGLRVAGGVAAPSGASLRGPRLGQAAGAGLREPPHPSPTATRPCSPLLPLQPLNRGWVPRRGLKILLGSSEVMGASQAPAPACLPAELQVLPCRGRSAS